MEYNHLCAVGGFESKMKFSPRLAESPPPKPPRRRYSEQHSPLYLGNHPPKKCYGEIQKGDSKSKIFIGKSAYLSLPASLSVSVSNEDDDPFNIHSHASDPSDHNKVSKEKEILRKLFLDCFKKEECHSSKQISSVIIDKEKLQSVSQNIISDKLLKNQSDSFGPFVIDKFLQNSCKDEPSLPSNVINHCQKTIHKNCYRRHSDPIIYHHVHYNDPASVCFNFLKGSTLKFDWEHCCDRMSHSIKKKKNYDSVGSCTCCKKTYFIMQEIRNLKEINEKLWQHLCSLQICLENRKKKTHHESSNISVSDLLSSIYYAQKAKDSAMEERLKVSLEERDLALREIDGLVHALTRSCDYADIEKDFNENKKDLLDEGSCTGNLPRLLRYQRVLLAQFNNLKSLKQDSFSHQLKQVTSERNSALEKIRQLEEDIRNMKTCFDLWHSDNKHWEVTMLDVLNQTMHQRDSVLSKIDNRFDMSNIKYRLDSFQQNLLPFDPRSKTVESLKTYQSSSDFKHQHSLKTSDEVKELKEEILLLNKALESEKKKRELSEKKCLRLERLIHILRKKLNGQDIGVHV